LPRTPRKRPRATQHPEHAHQLIPNTTTRDTTRGKAGSFDLSENPCPSPYERSLSEIAFREDPERATVSIVAEAQVLRIKGGREALDLLADNLEGFASETGASDHCHVDSPTYGYVATESDSLVIAFMK
ncbi:Imm32 family immunity protein, partial [Streptomyces mauvecolor]